MEKITLYNPLDMHAHLRQGAMLESVLPYSSLPFSALLAMPNLAPPLFSVDMVLAYKKEILRLVLESQKNGAFLNGNNGNCIRLQNLDSKNTPYFTPLMSLYISENLNESELQKAARNGIKILKLYPKGATTNSADGLSEILTPKFLKLLDIAQNLNMILSIHGESGGFSMEREAEFLPIFTRLANDFPRLKIIIEHLSDRRSIECIHAHSNLFGTITLHHMLLSLDDILGARLNPFAFCKPIVKTPQDRDAILQTALSGDSKFSFGSDSAPHSIESKLQGAAGIFSAPIALQGLCDLFDKHNALENLQKFVSDNAMEIYDINLSFTKAVTLTKSKCHFGTNVKCENDEINVFLGDKDLNYSISDISII